MALSQRALNVVGSITLKIDALAKQMKADGKDVIGFGAGEPDFDTPKYIIDAAKKAMDNGMTRYTPAAGMLNLKEAICQKLLNENGLSYVPKNIVVSNGAKHSLYNVFQAIVDAGDEVVIPSPYWVSYPEMVKLCGGVPVFVETHEKDGFLAKAEEIEKVITKNTKAILINSPSNPCGGVYDFDELKKIAEVAKKHELYIISDEIYEKLIYNGKKHYSIATVDEETKKLTIVVNGFSKAYAMTGWRLGYLAAPIEIASAISRMQSHETSNANSIAQWAGLEALKNGTKELNDMVNEFDERRKLAVKLINQTPHISCEAPDGAFYIMLNISEIIGTKYNSVEIVDSMDFASMLLEHECVAVVPGAAFGDDNFVRLSYAVSREKIEEGIKRIGNFVSKVEF
ncbi:MAG: pyridoxal phosphate-dependent aminotransferase [Clostridia bacterium]|nr:pyridoxal phosphate-dependent aminotransferase [Clostridia bacterium]